MENSIKNHFMVFGCFIGLSILQYYTLGYIISLVKQQSTGAYLIALFIMILFTASVFLLYFKIVDRETFRLNGIRWKTGLHILLLCISHFLFVSVISGYPTWVGKSSIPNGYIIRSFYEIFCYSVIAEILFRGLLQKQLSKILNPWLAIFIVVIVSSIVGFLYTQHLYQSFLAGIFIGIIYHKTDKLILCILYHSFYKLMCYLFHFSFEYGTSFQTAFVFIATGLAVYSIRKLVKNNYKNNELYA